MENTKSKRKLKVVLVLAVLVALLLLGYYLWQNKSSLALGILDGGENYQAVFLSNGQVYFGQVSNRNSTYVLLKDVYYLQVNQVLQPVAGKKEPEPQQALSLAKLGTSELHKPKDEMYINRDHILFIEDLESDSQVVQAIEKYKESQK